MSVFSFTLDPIVHLNPKGHVDFYVTGGGGLFHRYQEFTAPTVSVVTGFDPFFGFYPVAVQANQILANYSVNKPGMDIGAGVAFGRNGMGNFSRKRVYAHFHGQPFRERYGVSARYVRFPLVARVTQAIYSAGA